MKKFEFKLEKLLSYKGQMLDSELMKLAVIRKILAEQEANLQCLFAEEDVCQRNFEEKLRGNVTPAVYQIHTPYINDLKDKIKSKQREIDIINETLNDQIEKVKGFKQEEKSLKMLKESRFDEHKKQDMKKTEQLIEEFVSGAMVNSGTH